MALCRVSRLTRTAKKAKKSENGQTPPNAKKAKKGNLRIRFYDGNHIFEPHAIASPQMSPQRDAEGSEGYGEEPTKRATLVTKKTTTGC